MAVPALLIEARCEYCVSIFILLLRWFVRFKLRQWYWDDLFAVGVAITLSSLLAALELLSQKGAPAGLTAEARQQLPSELVVQLESGAKLMYAAFYLYAAAIWCLKGCMVVFYLRLTDGLRLKRFIWGVAALSIAFFFAAIITLLAHCIPISHNWQVLPDPGAECSDGYNINIVVASGNFTTDFLLLLTPVMMLRKVQIPLWRKIRIGFLLSLGGVVMAFTLLRCILTIYSPRTINQSSIWAMRELLVAVFAVNAPILNSLFRRNTWTGSFPSSSKNTKSSQMLGSGVDEPRDRGSSRDIYKMTDIEVKDSGSDKDLIQDEYRHGRAQVWAGPNKNMRY
ncbi:hypothetical protein AYO20_02809 [Fonsecaea nubica]|uniref:Rhodopsin domain-containing protein n=1 Tax=Fonsecaea nubica TaxID=856822 RepID=A0A178D8A9_9EURO|nr:hypothetical protein AYO20_02809 [Fonsecaea nubica]OAL37976.1 hypothetical protein AYO20_02809 [Fonsecaea nubica]